MENEKIVDILEKMVDDGFANKRVGENYIYVIENGEVVKKLAKNCVTYETKSKGSICFK